MQPVYCECPDRYWEFVCGKGDVVEASFDTVSSLCVFDAQGEIATAPITSCTLSTVTCDCGNSGRIQIKRKRVLSMAHGCEFISFADHSVVQQKAGIDMKEGDLVSILNDGQYVIFLRSINGSIAIWVLSQNWER